MFNSRLRTRDKHCGLGTEFLHEKSRLNTYVIQKAGQAAGSLLNIDSDRYPMVMAEREVATMYFLISLTAPISRLLIIMLFFSVSDNRGRAVFVDD